MEAVEESEGLVEDFSANLVHVKNISLSLLALKRLKIIVKAVMLRKRL